MELEKKEKELLIRAFTFYYKEHIRNNMVNCDNSKASDEDYNVRALTTKLGIRDMFPDEIKLGW
ncbi:hypothetical protein JW813_13205 [Clostridium botulinum]|uniref:hypothetical protein n=1 Tax=Clostridium TaxID=1485 RepID=UPI0020793BDC|nr:MULTISPECIES: hypothetical protein [Clostridium]UZP02660.1 hypothetical protein JW813_13205 [Clostridium botulinum]UZP06017.1 hypothetical protein JYA71_13470 [Clostridium botulinum]UZP09399.1 hypothetical protein JYA74_13200 [Clostridium botulinum]